MYIFQLIIASVLCAIVSSKQFTFQPVFTIENVPRKELNQQSSLALREAISSTLHVPISKVGSGKIHEETENSIFVSFPIELDTNNYIAVSQDINKIYSELSVDLFQTVQSGIFTETVKNAAIIYSADELSNITIYTVKFEKLEILSNQLLQESDVEHLLSSENVVFKPKAAPDQLLQESDMERLFSSENTDHAKITLKGHEVQQECKEIDECSEKEDISMPSSVPTSVPSSFPSSVPSSASNSVEESTDNKNQNSLLQFSGFFALFNVSCTSLSSEGQQALLKTITDFADIPNTNQCEYVGVTNELQHANSLWDIVVEVKFTLDVQDFPQFQFDPVKIFESIKAILQESVSQLASGENHNLFTHELIVNSLTCSSDEFSSVNVIKVNFTDFILKEKEQNDNENCTDNDKDNQNENGNENGNSNDNTNNNGNGNNSDHDNGDGNGNGNDNENNNNNGDQTPPTNPSDFEITAYWGIRDIKDNTLTAAGEAALLQAIANVLDISVNQVHIVKIIDKVTVDGAHEMEIETKIDLNANDHPEFNRNTTKIFLYIANLLKESVSNDFTTLLHTESASLHANELTDAIVFKVDFTEFTLEASPTRTPTRAPVILSSHHFQYKAIFWIQNLTSSSFSSVSKFELLQAIGMLENSDRLQDIEFLGIRQVINDHEVLVAVRLTYNLEDNDNATTLYISSTNTLRNAVHNNQLEIQFQKLAAENHDGNCLIANIIQVFFEDFSVTESSTTSKENAKKTPLSKAALGGIISGGIIFLALVAFTSYFLYTRYFAKSDDEKKSVVAVDSLDRIEAQGMATIVVDRDARDYGLARLDDCSFMEDNFVHRHGLSLRDDDDDSGHALTMGNSLDGSA
jgi:hypothetical protein